MFKQIQQDRSQAFQTVVSDLRARGWKIEEILALLLDHPNCGPVQKYGARLATEIQRSWSKAEKFGGRTAAEAFQAEFSYDQPLPPGAKRPLGNNSPGTPWSLISAADEIEPNLEDNYRIEDLIPNRGLVVVVGPPGSAKTSLVIHMCLAIAGASTTWFGKSLESAPVLYLSLEGAAAFKNRIVACQSEHGRASAFHRCCAHVNIRESADCDRIVEAGRSISAKLVVIDTLNRSIGGGDENSSIDMGLVLDACGRIESELECAVILIHHTGKDAGRGARGHSSLLGAADTEITVERTENERLMTVTKQRDGKDGLKFPFALKTVELGRTPKGKLVTSCVIEERNFGITNQSQLAAQQNADRVFLKLLRLHRDQGRTVNAGGGTNYAPSLFQKHPESEGLTRPAFRDAMNRLFSSGRIENIEKGPKSRRTKEISEVNL